MTRAVAAASSGPPGAAMLAAPPRPGRPGRPHASLRAATVAAACALAALTAPTVFAEGVDFIVMVDTSESMFAAFDDVVGYVLRDILTRVEPGDSVHLLNFDTTPNVVFSARIDQSDRLRELIDRVLLLNPLGGYTDLVRAARFLGTYARGLPAGNDRRIILLTDGIHDPPPGSATDRSFEEVLAALLRSVDEIQQQGWSVRFLQLFDDAGAAPAVVGAEAPAAAAGQADAGGNRDGAAPLLDAIRREFGDDTVVPLDAGGTLEPTDAAAASPGSATGSGDRASAPGGVASADSLPTPRATAGAGEGVGDSRTPVSQQALDRIIALPTLAVPADLGQVRRRFRLPLSVTNHGDEPLLIRLESVQVRGTALLHGQPSATAKAGESVVLYARLVLGDDLLPGPHLLRAEFSFAQDLRVSPRALDLSFTLQEGGLLPRVALTVILVAAGAIVALVALALLFRALRDALAAAGAARVAHVIQHGAIEMRVADQSRRNRLRNVHALRPGQAASVGGGRSTFLIFLYPVPARIAELAFDGSRYQFIPRDRDSLPGVQAPLPDCLEQHIDVRSRTGRSLTVWFERYRSPLEEINALMRRVTPRPPASGDAAQTGSFETG